MNAGGGCESAVTARKMCGWIRSMACGELLNGIGFSLRPKGVSYKSYVRLGIMYGSEAWCLKESEIGILQRTERSMGRAMCAVHLKNR